MKTKIIAFAAALMVLTGSMAMAATSSQTATGSQGTMMQMNHNGYGHNGYGHNGYGHGGGHRGYGHGTHSGGCWF